MLVCSGGCNQVPQMGSLDVTAWRLDILGGGIGSFGCLGPTVVEQSPVWAGVGGSGGMPGTLSRSFYKRPLAITHLHMVFSEHEALKID